MILVVALSPYSNSVRRLVICRKTWLAVWTKGRCVLAAQASCVNAVASFSSQCLLTARFRCKLRNYSWSDIVCCLCSMGRHRGGLRRCELTLTATVMACRAPNSDWGAAAVRSAQPATNNPFASPDVPETAPVDGFGDSAFGAPPAAGGVADSGFGDSAFGEKPAFGAWVFGVFSVGGISTRGKAGVTCFLLGGAAIHWMPRTHQGSTI